MLLQSCIQYQREQEDKEDMPTDVCYPLKYKHFDFCF